MEELVYQHLYSLAIHTSFYGDLLECLISDLAPSWGKGDKHFFIWLHLKITHQWAQSISVTDNIALRTKLKMDGECVIELVYQQLYGLVVQASFYGNMVECLITDPAA